MSFYQEEVVYRNNQADIQLAGTLTLPKQEGKFPAVVLIAGYGPNDRDVTGMGHTYFKVLAEYLTQQGIAVLRYDKRGVGQSEGDWSAVTTVELATDACAGVDYLKTRTEINSSKIGLVGLSEGGLIAAMLGAQRNDIAFAVLMAPHVAFGVDDLVFQAGLQLRADGASVDFVERDKAMRTAVYTIIKEEADQVRAQERARAVIQQFLDALSEQQKQEAEKLPFAFTAKNLDMLVPKLTAPGYRFFMTYDPRAMLMALRAPTLVVASEADSMVSCAKTFPILKQAFEQSGHADYTLQLLPNLNHVFQTCKTGAIAEYATIKETMAPVVLQTISDWVLERTK